MNTAKTFQWHWCPRILLLTWVLLICSCRWNLNLEATIDANAGSAILLEQQLKDIPSDLELDGEENEDAGRVILHWRRKRPVAVDYVIIERGRKSNNDTWIIETQSDDPKYDKIEIFIHRKEHYATVQDPELTHDLTLVYSKDQ